MNIDKENLLKALRNAAWDGLRTHELADAMGADVKGRHRLRTLLGTLVDEKVVEKAPGGRYRVVGREAPVVKAGPTGEALPKGWVTGSLRVHPAGYGFVVRDDGEDDAFVAARNRGPAMDGDKIALSTWLGYKGTEGRVEKILDRGRAKLTGTFRKQARASYIEPDDPRIAATGGHVLLDGAPNGAKDGQAVVAEITRYPTMSDEPLSARIIHVLGDPDDPRTEIEKILIISDIPTEFPEEVLKAAEQAPTEVKLEDLADRVDLRERNFMTIDPETARDFDDAVCVEASPKGPEWSRLWVAVADVSHYVRPGTPLDAEARKRGCSVYLPDRAIPMLPRQLSAGICSLNPDVDRMAMVARMEIDPQGGVHDEYFCAAVIRSHARLDYPGVAAALSGDFRGARARYQPLLPDLERMAALARRMRARRLERGSLDFDLPEAKVVLDEDDPTRVRDVVQSRGDAAVKGAYQLVEDFMLAANESVARHFGSRELDTVWRVHDIPSDERLQLFANLAQAFGLQFDPEDGRSPKKLFAFLVSIKGKPIERALNFMMLRTLKQAVYDTTNVGHFGLGAPDYLHFTSPIRRYPDLIVHRLLKNSLHADGLPAGGNPGTRSSRETLQQMAVESSKSERRAMEAERSVVDLYRAVLMKDRIGEEFEGTVAAVVSFGLFVQIEKPFVEGLVKLGVLDDQYEYDEQTQRLVGRTTGRQFALGDPVKVRVENVSVQQRKIDFALLSHTASAPAIIEPPGGKRRDDKRDGRKPLRPSPARRRGRDDEKRAGNSQGRSGRGAG
ncbi:MAG: ribonuclease, partial [Myxococcales bacterium]|nr:ribonuclease [Myxococcales bacterium]